MHIVFIIFIFYNVMYQYKKLNITKGYFIPYWTLFLSVNAQHAIHLLCKTIRIARVPYLSQCFSTFSCGNPNVKQKMKVKLWQLNLFSPTLLQA